MIKELRRIKIQRLRRLAESLKTVDKFAAWDLISLINNAEGNSPVILNESARSSTIDAIKKISQSFEGGTWALCGGLAIMQYISSRSTEDIDIVISSSEKINLPDLKPISIGHTTSISGVSVDIIEPSDHMPWIQDSVDTAQKMNVLGVTIPVVLPEYLRQLSLDNK